jgi:hypothetical protein
VAAVEKSVIIDIYGEESTFDWNSVGSPEKIAFKLLSMNGISPSPRMRDRIKFPMVQTRYTKQNVRISRNMPFLLLEEPWRFRSFFSA